MRYPNFYDGSRLDFRLAHKCLFTRGALATASRQTALLCNAASPWHAGSAPNGPEGNLRGASGQAGVAAAQLSLTIPYSRTFRPGCNTSSFLNET